MFILRQFVYMLLSHWGKIYAFNHIKKQGLLVYLKTLQTIRKSLLGAILFVCLLQLMVLGGIGTFVTGVFLSNSDLNTKLWILLAGFLLILTLPVIGLAMLFSEKLWFKLSGAEEYFNAEMERAHVQDEVPASNSFAHEGPQ